jgi:putative DNA primase/helicase
MVAEHTATVQTSGPPAPAEALALSRACRAAGISTIPIRCDRSKAPAVSTWDPYKRRLPTEAEIESWFRDPAGVAVIGGKVSGGLFVIDSEYPDFTAALCELVGAEDAGLMESLPHVRTPGKSKDGGDHFYGRSPVPVPSGKLARLTEAEARERTGDPKKTTAIEVKAEGGYCLAPGCPASCHESGRLYVHVAGPFIEDVPTLTEEQVGILLDAARALDHTPGPKVEEYHGSGAPATRGGRPGDVFNRAADWWRVLVPHGWALVRRRGGVCYWRRPGKDKGVSATTGYCRSETAGDLLCVFSTNADPLTIPDGKDHQCFSKFAAYALLNHKGDFRAAARAVRPPRHRKGLIRFSFSLGAQA